MSAHEISPGAHDSAAETAGLSRSEWIRRCCAEATTALIDAAGHDLDDRATEDAGRAAHAVTFAAEAHTPRDRASTSRAALPWSILKDKHPST